MVEFTPITSLQNPRIKHVVRLNNRRFRDQQRLTVVEGTRECRLALQSGIVPQDLFICPPLVSENDVLDVELMRLAQEGRTRFYEVTPAIFEKIAYRSASGGILLVIPFFERPLSDIPLSSNPFMIIVDGAEKPGNLGGILRTADAAGVDGLILTGAASERTDLHNPNTIRASLGAAFTVPVAAAARSDTAAWCHNHGIQILAASPEAHDLYTNVSMAGPTAIVLGSEAQGLGEDWLAAADIPVRIPMAGVVDSLNLSVSAALMLYEVVRQREAHIK